MRRFDEIFATAFRELKPSAPVPCIQVQFRPYANVNSSIRLRDGQLLVRLSDLLKGAPLPVLRALAVILLSKLYRMPVPRQVSGRFRRFLNQRDVRRQARKVRHVRGRKLLAGPHGDVYDLDRLFDQLNAKYFDDRLSKPLLGWSRVRSKTMLGHFDPAHNTITISRLLDSAALPSYVVEYLMYHEMLHVKHPVEYCGGRRRMHSLRFQADEARFEHYQAARNALKKLPLCQSEDGEPIF